MEGALVSAAAGALKPVVEKLGAALGKKYKGFKGVRDEIKVFTAELTHMHAFLLKMSEDEDPDVEDKAWANEVRELSYDIEDNLDDFMVSVDGKPAKRHGLMDKMKNLLEKTKARHRIAKAMEDFKKQVIEVGERHARYSYKTSEAIAKPSNERVDNRALAMFEDVSNLVGIDRPKDEVIKLLTQEDGSGSSKQQLKVVSIFGFGGLGKTTLASQVYQELKGQFECQAFVSVSRNPDVMAILRTILSKVSGIPYRDTEAGSREQLIDDIRVTLQDKRYIVVVDDLWNKEHWDIIKCAFVKNSKGSRIIITTRRRDVAESCSSSVARNVYGIRPLDPMDSKKLFLRRIFGSEDKCPQHLMEVSDKILTQCDGLPLALISISGLLASKPHAKDEWYRVQNSMGRALEKNPDVESMMKILSLSYFDLPPHLKTCMLYLSIFPEDSVIDKICLVRRWIAEGFIHEEWEGFTHQGGRRHTLYELGEMCFYELINRSLIQPANRDMFGEVSACRVHDTILDFIILKAVEENFITLSGDGYPMLKRCDKVRRLSLHASSQENVCTLAGLNLSHVRSLTVLVSGYPFVYPVGLPCLGQWDMRFLRVLDLKGCMQIEGHHLANMGNLFQLKYLSIIDSGKIELPVQIGKLQHLETLNIEGTGLRELPQSIARLHRLVHMVIDAGVKLPDEIGNMVALQKLKQVNVFKQTIQFTHEIGKLTDLRDLSLSFSYDVLMECATGGGSCYKEYMDNIMSSLAKLPYLHSLYVNINPGQADEHFSLDSGASVPRGLRTFVIHSYQEAYVTRVPNWMCFLVNLQRVILRVMEFEVGDILVLGHLPALALLKLTVHESFFPESVAVIGNHGFECLRHFDFTCAVPVMFQEGAMPKLEKLTLAFSREKTQVQAGDGDFLFGIQHLPSLCNVRCLIHYNYDVVITEMETRIDEMSCEAAKVKLAEMEATMAEMEATMVEIAAVDGATMAEMEATMAEMEAVDGATVVSVLPSAEGGAKGAIRREVKVHPNAPKLELRQVIVGNELGWLSRVASTRSTLQEFGTEANSFVYNMLRKRELEDRIMKKRREVYMRFRNCQLKGYDGSTEEIPQFEEMKDSDPVMDDCYHSCDYPPAPDSVPETVSSAKPFCSAPTQDVLHGQKEPSPSKIVTSASTSLDEMKRIMDGLTPYEVLGIPRNISDLRILKKEYKRMVLLVHPDKNMGNSLALESFKKLKSAYEVLSDSAKKNSYDEQLRKEESRQMTQRSRLSTGITLLQPLEKLNLLWL